MNILQWLHDKWFGIPLGGMARASDWAWWRKQHIKDRCEYCGKKGTLLKPLELHHVCPFHKNPELEKKLQFVKKDLDNMSFADEVFIFCSLMKKTMIEVQNYTVYQFKKQLEHLLILKDFDLYKPLEVSGQIKFQNKDTIKHYLSGSKKSGRYDSILVKKDSYVETNDIFKL